MGYKSKYASIDASIFIDCTQKGCIGTMNCEQDYDDYDDFGTGTMVSMECDECFHNKKVLFLDEYEDEQIIDQETLEILCQT